MNVGDVFRIFTTLTNPPKEKIVVYVGTERELFFWFNTEARQRPAQMSCAAGDAPKITHDCFLDCGRATTFRPEELIEAESCGRAGRQFLERVLREVTDNATTLTTLQRKAICESLVAAIKDMM